MTKKRRSGGRTGSQSGRDQPVQCAKCGRFVPRGKAKRVTKYVSLVDATIGKELRDAGAIVPRRQVTNWYCVSCAIHTHKVHIRAGDDRRKHEKIR
ncbi:MAG: 30S ribosomal protein S26e [Candidatus Lokiarchaeota archaeon]|nr:30S ribosomal protein S26e [Candidatus Harpocratesius repetitus]